MSKSHRSINYSRKSVLGEKFIYKILTFIFRPKDHQHKRINQYLERAKIAKEQGKLEEALGYYQNILSLKADYAEVYYYRLQFLIGSHCIGL